MGQGQKPRRPVFSERGSYVNWVLIRRPLQGPSYQYPQLMFLQRINTIFNVFPFSRNKYLTWTADMDRNIFMSKRKHGCHKSFWEKFYLYTTYQIIGQHLGKRQAQYLDKTNGSNTGSFRGFFFFFFSCEFFVALLLLCVT